MISRKLLEDAIAFTSSYVTGDFLYNPRTFNQKLAWLKIFDNPPLKTRCADKLAVRGYIEEKLGVDASVPLLGVWNDPADIDFDALPDRFVLKCNHGSGYNIVVRDKSTLDRDKTVRQLRDWLDTDYSTIGYELFYRDIPRKCFAEEYIGDGVSDIKDWKFLCFNGEPIICQAISDRNNENRRLNHYDMDFRFMDLQVVHFGRRDFPSNPDRLDERPASFETMKDYARKLSADFKFVRVDFFDVAGRAYVGELTFVPFNARMKFDPRSETEQRLGNLLSIYGEPLTPRPAPTGLAPALPDVSVIIPVYNGREFAGDCVSCLKAQTHANAEFIIVDDKSSDGSADAFEEMTAGDSRFRILRHETRTDLFHARRTGVLAARGRYVMFLDVDDLIVPDACKCVTETMDRTGADLFCHGASVTNIGRASDRDVADTQAYLDREPAHGLVPSPEECRELFFGPRAWSASAWNKAVRTDVAQSAFESIRTDRNLGCAQDYFQSVLLFLRIRSLWSDVSQKLYVYRLGQGVSRLPKGEVTKEKFERILTAVQVEAELRDLLARENGLPDGFKAFIADEFSSRIRAGTLLSLWNLPGELIPWGFDAMLSAWGIRALSSPAFDIGRLWDNLPELTSCASLRKGTDGGSRIGLYAGRRNLSDILPAGLRALPSERPTFFVPLFEREPAVESAMPTGFETAETLPPAPGSGLPKTAIPLRDERLDEWIRIVRERRLDSIWFLAPPPFRFAAETLALRASGVRVFIWREGCGIAVAPASPETDSGVSETELTFELEAAASLANGIAVRHASDEPFSLAPPPPPPCSPFHSALLRAAARDRTNARERLNRVAKRKNEAVKARDRTIEAQKKAAEARDRNIAGKAKLIAYRNAEIARLTGICQSRKTTIEKKDAAISAAKEQLTRAKARLGDLAQSNARLKSRSEALAGRLSGIRTRNQRLLETNRKLAVRNRQLERSLALRLARLPVRLLGFLKPHRR